MQYIKSLELKVLLRGPRDAMARDYRAIRAKNPAMARLLKRRLSGAVDSYVESVWGEGTGSPEGGLADLLK